MDFENIKNIVNHSISNLNSDLPEDDEIKLDDKFRLVGEKSSVDSVIYLNLMLEIEKNLNLNYSLLEQLSNDLIIDLTLKDLYLKIFKIFNKNA